VKAIQIHETGGPEVLRLEGVPDPQPGPGEAVVRLEAIGLNFIEVYQRTGLYRSPLPFTPGGEGAGRIVAVGRDVSGVKPGDRVASTSLRGSYAELARVPVDKLVPVPDEVETSLAAAVLLQGLTAHYLVTSTYPLAQGSWCLIHAAAGGVGLLLCQMAKARGARVIGTVSTEEKAALATQAGADHVVLYTRQDFVSEARRLTGGQGVAKGAVGVLRCGIGCDLRRMEAAGVLDRASVDLGSWHGTTTAHRPCPARRVDGQC